MTKLRTLKMSTVMIALLLAPAAWAADNATGPAAGSKVAPPQAGAPAGAPGTPGLPGNKSGPAVNSSGDTTGSVNKAKPGSTGVTSGPAAGTKVAPPLGAAPAGSPGTPGLPGSKSGPAKQPSK